MAQDQVMFQFNKLFINFRVFIHPFELIKFISILICMVCFKIIKPPVEIDISYP